MQEKMQTKLFSANTSLVSENYFQTSVFQELDLVILVDPFQPGLFYDYMVLSSNYGL